MSTQASGLGCRFAHVHGMDAPGSPGRNVLGRVAFLDHQRSPAIQGGVPEVGVHMAADATGRVTEVWETDAPVMPGVRGDLAYAHDGEYLFCAGHVPESRTYREPVGELYRAAFALVTEFGYPNVLRIWHFISGINHTNDDGLEIYRDFCQGRAEAVDQCLPRPADMPAATGIGCRGGGISVFLLASRSGRRRNVENPLQVPAPDYPRRYGPQPPKFARATYFTPAGAGGGGDVFVAGTSSIRGHETVHPGDVAKQCDVTLGNLAHLISRDNMRAHGIDDGRTLKDLRYIKVYVRRAEDIPVVKAICAEAFSPAAETVYFNVDICRKDLLLEVEGVSPRPGANEGPSALPGGTTRST